MLADGKDEGVVQGQALALGLDDVDVVALGVRSGVAGDELVRGVLAGVDDGQGKASGWGMSLMLCMRPRLPA